MNRPLYAELKAHYPDRFHVDATQLYAQIGHPEYIDVPEMQNTCAVRVSLALIATGFHIAPGHMTILNDKFKGRRIEQSQTRLSDLLVQHWGEPERFSGALARERIGQRQGVIRFLQLWGPFDPQGHIDLVAPDRWNRLMCEGSCFWDAVEVWFWPLQ